MITLMERLQRSLAVGTSDERSCEVQGLLCGALQAIIIRMDSRTIAQHADGLMMMFLRVLQAKSATLNEEAFMAIGVVASCVQSDFAKYVDALKPFLVEGLNNTFEPQVCDVGSSRIVSLY